MRVLRTGLTEARTDQALAVILLWDASDPLGGTLSDKKALPLLYSMERRGRFRVPAGVLA